MLRFKKADPAFSSAGVIRVKGGGGRDQKRRARNKPVVSIFTLVAALLLITSSAFVYQSLPVQGVEDGSSSIIKTCLFLILFLFLFLKQRTNLLSRPRQKMKYKKFIMADVQATNGAE